MYVTKRDGTKESFNLDKTRKVIQWACEDLEVDPLELESHVDISFQNGIETQDIQENLITQSLGLVDLNHYDWLKVAANLRMMTRYKIYREISFTNYVKQKVSENKYSKLLTDKYTDEDLDTSFTWVDKESDKLYDYAGSNTLISKFMLDDEPLQYLCLSSALVIASVEKNKNEQLQLAYDLYEAFSLKKISLPTPTLSGIRKGKANLASCFIGTMGDSLDEIYETLHKIAKISKNGGGVGLYIGDIRCNGSWIQGLKGAAGGVIRWIKLVNDTVVAVDQLGKRSGAVTVALPVWHYDLEEFLSLQTEHGDPRKKCFDILPQLVVSDEFMKRVKTNEDWYCFDPYEVKTKLGLNLSYTENYNEIVKNIDKLELVKKYSAKYLMIEIIKVIVETGLPYIANIDTINRANPNKHAGRILCVNLCTESYSNTTVEDWHTCSLVSLNLANIGVEETEKYSRLCVRLLDNILDLCQYPIKESENHVKKYRTTGIGVMGLADFFAKNGYTYESAYSSGFMSQTFERLCYFTIDESIDLAKTRGRYPMFEGSTWDTGERTQYLKQNSTIKEFDYDKLQSKLNTFGIRNSQLMSPAPNTTSSLVQGCVAGVLPPYNLLHYDDSSNGAVPIMPPYLSKHPLRYKAYKNYDMHTMSSYIAEMQKWIDTGISFEALFDLTQKKENGEAKVNAKYIYDFIMKCWNDGVRANYYFRYITPHGEESKKEECVSCSG
jgi:ribonucleoside-diphosphate reductase alpha chain